VVGNPNQIKHVENLGTWNPEDPNIYKAEVNFSQSITDTAQQVGLPQQLSKVDNKKFFGNSHSELESGNQQSSMNVLKHLIESKQVPLINSILADVLSRHDVPILFGENEFGTPAEIVERNGGFVIIIDPQ